MPADADSKHSRQLLVLALLVLAVSTVWSVRTPVGPNSDRYDYLGRAHQLLEGEGVSPLLVYPLRFAFDGAESWPVENLTRPPLWPTLVAGCMRLGVEDAAGVVMASLLAFCLLTLVAHVGDRSFGAGTGGFAALVVATSFASVRALWGGGPEIAIALLTFLLWTWSPAARGRIGYVVAGVSYGLLPWLHPIGFFYAALAFVARNHRYSRSGRLLILVVALALALPWYVQVGRQTGTPLGPLQSQAELAKATHDLGGLGPYRTLEPVPTFELFREETGQVLRGWAARGRDLLTHLDGWMAWPLLLLAILGARRDRPLALVDLGAAGLSIAVIALAARDPRLLVPLLPVAAIWAGAGWREILDRRVQARNIVLPVLLLGAAWLVPLGASAKPGTEVAGLAAETCRPPDTLLQEAGRIAATSRYIFTDRAVLAWRLRSRAVFLPDSPATLDRLRQLPGLKGPSLVLMAGDSRWMKPHEAAWRERFAAARVDTLGRDPDPLWAVSLDEKPVVAAEPAGPPAGLYVPESLALGREDVPTDLVSIPSPPATREGLEMRAASWEALSRMIAAAARDSVTLRVISAYRSYEYQEGLYGRAVEKHGPDQAWVAAPGTSEHQLGTTVDLADSDLEQVLEPEFATTVEGQWVAQHAEEFGFVLSYTPENESYSGYRPEPWHLRHRPELFPEPDSSQP